MIPLSHQIAELKRELALRAALYPSLIAKKKMRQGEADEHTARMNAALKTLEWVRDHPDSLAALLELGV